MIKWCIAIWDEENTLYFAYDKRNNSYYPSPFLEEAVVYDKIKISKLPIGVVWLPIFVPDPQ